MEEESVKIRERLTALETDFEHMQTAVDEMSKKVTAVHDLLMQARGAKWAVIGLAMLGGAITGKLISVFQLFSK
jgi:tetrahydromethanopterin S-methyltransferase subunit G